MPALERFADDVWIASQPHSMFGLKLGTRMTVVRLPDGGLWVHSPIALDEDLKAQIAELGPVRHVVAPNAFHHVYAGPWKQAFADAQLWGPASLQKKRKDLAFDSIIGRDQADWPFRTQHVGGCMLDETVYLHEASGTLIHCDLFENFNSCDHGPTRAYLKIGGVWQKPGLHPMIRLVYRDRAKAREAVNAVLAWDFDRVVLGHGDCVTDDAKAVTERGMAWLVGSPQTGKTGSGR